MFSHRWLLSILAIFLIQPVLLAKAAPDRQGADNATDEAATEDAATDYELFSVLVDTLDQVERNYVKEISRRELIEAAIQGLLSKLEDPYSSYIAPDDLTEFKRDVESQFGGIGIQIGVDDDELKVLSPLVGTPAYRAGLQSGDHIIEIEGESTRGITIEEAVNRLKGEVGTEVTLKIVHAGKSEPETVRVTREIIQIPTVLGDRRLQDGQWDYLLDAENKLGYVRISTFSRNTPDELRHALDGLVDKGMRGLILDLRFNPGGLLSSAIEVCDLFISEGRIVSTEGRNSKPRAWDAHEEDTFSGFPMVVLVNRFSASASEIVSACLQDHDRAVVIGERTWGKGSVQNVIELEGGKSALKLTTAGYLRPSGKNIDKFAGATPEDDWGVRPNDGFEIKLGDSEVSQLLLARAHRDAPNLVEPADDSSEKPDDPEENASPDEAKPDGEDQATEESEETPDGASKDDQSASDSDPKPAEDAEAATGDASTQGEFVDRQLKRAVEYLLQRLSAGKPDAANESSSASTEDANSDESGEE